MQLDRSPCDARHRVAKEELFHVDVASEISRRLPPFQSLYRDVNEETAVGSSGEENQTTKKENPSPKEPAETQPPKQRFQKMLPSVIAENE